MGRGWGDSRQNRAADADEGALGELLAPWKPDLAHGRCLEQERAGGVGIGLCILGRSVHRVAYLVH